MSFISTEPQSRVVLESHNNYLFAQFDTQLRIIADRYLSFFRERLSIYYKSHTSHYIGYERPGRQGERARELERDTSSDARQTNITQESLGKR